MIRSINSASRATASMLAARPAAVSLRGGAAVNPVYVERRQFGRRPCRIAAEIQYRHYRVSCIVLDQSEGGAFLAVDDAEILPARFTLVLPGYGIEIYVDVRHRSKDGVGVQFLRGDINTFRATFCQPLAAPASPPTPALAPRAQASTARAPSAVDLRRSLFRVVTGATERFISAIPLLLRREANSAVVLGTVIALSSRRLAEVEPSRRADDLPAAIDTK